MLATRLVRRKKLRTPGSSPSPWQLVRVHMCHPDSSDEKIATYQMLVDATATAEAGAAGGGDAVQGDRH